LQTFRPNAARVVKNDFKRLSFATSSDSRLLCCSNFTMGFKNVELDADFDPVKKSQKVYSKSYRPKTFAQR
jgi:hypothetical protein